HRHGRRAGGRGPAGAAGPGDDEVGLARPDPLRPTAREQRGQGRSCPADELRGIAQGRAEVAADVVGRAYAERVAAGQLGGGLEETLRQPQRGGRVGVGREHHQLAPPYPPDRIRAAPHRPEDAPQRLDRGIDVRRRIGCEYHTSQRGPASVHVARELAPYTDAPAALRLAQRLLETTAELAGGDALGIRAGY